MKWLKLSNPTEELTANWIAADVATRMDSGKAVVALQEGGWVAWRTTAGNSMLGFGIHSQPDGSIVATYSAHGWKGRIVKSLESCEREGKLVWRPGP